MTQLKLSKRALASMDVHKPMSKMFTDALPLLCNCTLNPTGAINLGVAHNDLMKDELLEKTKSCLEVTVEDFNYSAPNGSHQLRTVVANILNTNFKAYNPILPDHIFIHTGATASIYHLIMTIADPGEYVMLQAPYFGVFDKDISVDTGVNILSFRNPDVEDLSVNIETLEAAYSQAIEEGKKVTAVVVANPHNPSGMCYSRKDIETYVKFAGDHSLHVIFDEIYALSTFGHLLPDTPDENPFVSVMSLDNLEDLIEPSNVHVIYGLSKDFNLNGFRVGFIIDQYNPLLREALLSNNSFSHLSTIVDRMLLNMLSDKLWVEDFLKTNQERLAMAYLKATKVLNDNQLDYIPSVAGHFIFLNLGKTFESIHGRKMTFEDENELKKKLLCNGVYIVPGYAFHCHQPGFFRLTFSVLPEDLEDGLMIILGSLH